MDFNINVNMSKNVSETKEILDREKVRVIMFNTDGSLTTMSSEERYNHHTYFNKYYKLINKEIEQVPDIAKRLERSTDIDFLTIYNVANNSRLLFMDFSRGNKTGAYGYFILPIGLTEAQYKSLQDMKHSFDAYREMSIDKVTVDAGYMDLTGTVFASGKEAVSEINKSYVKEGSKYRLKSTEEINQDNEEKQKKSSRRR